MSAFNTVYVRDIARKFFDAANEKFGNRNRRFASADPAAANYGREQEGFMRKAGEVVRTHKLLSAFAGAATLFSIPFGAYELYGAATVGPELGVHYAAVKVPVGTKGKGSLLLATVAAMLKGEANAWCPSCIALDPSAYRLDTCGVNIGEAKVLRRVLWEIQDRASRLNTNSATDGRLEKALAYVNRDLDQWVPGFRTTGNFREAARLIESYNQDVADGKAGFYKHINTLSPIVGQLRTALGAQFGQLHNTDHHSGYFQLSYRTEFSEAVGVVKATRDILEAVGQEFEGVLDRQSTQDLVEPALETANYILKHGIPDVIANTEGKFNDVGNLAGEISALNQNLHDFEGAFGAAASITPVSPRLSPEPR